MACNPENLEKLSALAKEAIGESGVNIEVTAKNVRRLVLEKYPELRLPPEADQLIARSLRVRKFQIDRVVVQVHDYFKFFEYLYGVHQKMEYFLPSTHREYFFDSGGFEVLKNRDSQGRVVLLFNYDRLPPEGYSLDAVLAMLTLVLEELHQSSVDTQRLGIVILADFKGFSVGHMKSYTPSRLHACMKLMRGGLPVRYKGIHLAGANSLLSQLYAIFKPLLGSKLKSRIHIHGADLTEFHLNVSPDILPEHLGGTLTGSEHADKAFVERLLAKDEYYKESLKYGYLNNVEN